MVLFVDEADPLKNADKVVEITMNISDGDERVRSVG